MLSILGQGRDTALLLRLPPCSLDPLRGREVMLSGWGEGWDTCKEPVNQSVQEKS